MVICFIRESFVGRLYFNDKTWIWYNQVTAVLWPGKQMKLPSSPADLFSKITLHWLNELNFSKRPLLCRTTIYQESYFYPGKLLLHVSNTCINIVTDSATPFATFTKKTTLKENDVMSLYFVHLIYQRRRYQGTRYHHIITDSVTWCPAMGRAWS